MHSWSVLEDLKAPSPNYAQPLSAAPKGRGCGGKNPMPSEHRERTVALRCCVAPQYGSDY